MVRNGRDLRGLLTDLVAWGERVERIVGETSRDEILKDEMAEHALCRVVEVFGDLAGRIQRDFPAWCRAHSPDDFSDAYRLRNKLAHGYDTIRPDFLYDIAATDVAELVGKARAWLADPDLDPAPDARP